MSDLDNDRHMCLILAVKKVVPVVKVKEPRNPSAFKQVGRTCAQMVTGRR